MSKGNIFMGQSSGKIGSVVTFVKNGQQMTRVWTKSGARSGEYASLPARAQRVAFGAASSEWELYKYMSTRLLISGKRSHESDYNYFVRLNWRNFPYLTKAENEHKMHIPIPGWITKGNLGTLAQYMRTEQQQNGDNVYSSLYIPALSGLDLTPGGTTADLGAQIRAILPNATKMAIAAKLGHNWVLGNGNNISGEQMTYVTIDLLTGYVNGIKEAAELGVLGKSILVELGIPYQQVSSDVLIGDKSTGVFFKAQLNGKYSSGINGEYFLRNYQMWIIITNESTQDCYSTYVTAPYATEDYNPYREWYEYKQAFALQEACESYGYSADVLQSTLRNTEDVLLDNRSQYIEYLIKMDGMSEDEATAKADANIAKIKSDVMAKIEEKKQEAANNSAT